MKGMRRSQETCRLRLTRLGLVSMSNQGSLFTLLHTCAECQGKRTLLFLAFFPMLAYDNVHYHHLTPCGGAVINDYGGAPGPREGGGKPKCPTSFHVPKPGLRRRPPPAAARAAARASSSPASN